VVLPEVEASGLLQHILKVLLQLFTIAVDREHKLVGTRVGGWQACFSSTANRERGAHALEAHRRRPRRACRSYLLPVTALTMCLCFQCPVQQQN
jgi:hypothetical protein